MIYIRSNSPKHIQKYTYTYIVHKICYKVFEIKKEHCTLKRKGTNNQLEIAIIHGPALATVSSQTCVTGPVKINHVNANYTDIYYH